MFERCVKTGNLVQVCTEGVLSCSACKLRQVCVWKLHGDR